MLCGLTHDLGEMYIASAHGEADADRALDFVSYQQLVVHPHVGSLLISQLTNYPASMARAVAEHHERWTARAIRTRSRPTASRRWAGCWPSPRPR
jgi:HD-GYP domain-containing protein (c-di-GMP phosphodiesterase class II)